MSIITRRGKGDSLEWDEMDDNLEYISNNINQLKYEIESMTFSNGLVYSNDEPTTVSIGGIPKDVRFDNIPITKLFDMMLHPDEEDAELSEVKLSNWTSNRSYSKSEIVKFDGVIWQSLEDDNNEEIYTIKHNLTDNWKESDFHTKNVFILDLHEETFPELDLYDNYHYVNRELDGSGQEGFELPIDVNENDTYIVIYQRVTKETTNIDIDAFIGYVSYYKRDYSSGETIYIHNTNMEIDDNILNSFILVDDYDKFIENFVNLDIIPGWCEMAIDSKLLMTDGGGLYQLIECPMTNPNHFRYVSVSDKWENLNKITISDYVDKIYHKDEVVYIDGSIYRSTIDNNDNYPIDVKISDNWKEFDIDVKYGFYPPMDENGKDLSIINNFENTTIDNWLEVNIDDDMVFKSPINMNKGDHFYLVIQNFNINYVYNPLLIAFSGLLVEVLDDISEGENIIFDVNVALKDYLVVISNDSESLVEYLKYNGDNICDVLTGNGLSNLISNENNTNIMYEMVDCSIIEKIILDNNFISDGWEKLIGNGNDNDGSLNDIIELTQMDAIQMSVKGEFIINQKYKIIDADYNLYGGTEIILEAISDSELSSDGIGYFYNSTLSGNLIERNAIYVASDTNYYWGGHIYKCIKNTDELDNYGYVDLDIDIYYGSPNDFINSIMSIGYDDISFMLDISDIIGDGIISGLADGYNGMEFSFNDWTQRVESHYFDYDLSDVPNGYIPEEDFESRELIKYRFKKIASQVTRELVGYYIHTLGYIDFYDFVTIDDNGNILVDYDSLFINKGIPIVVYHHEDYVEFNETLISGDTLIIVINGILDVGYYTTIGGNLGDFIIDPYRLQKSYFEKLEGNEYYELSIDKIKYDLRLDKIYYRNERDINIVEYNPATGIIRDGRYIKDNPIKAFLWGKAIKNISIGSGNDIVKYVDKTMYNCYIKNSYCEIINNIEITLNNLRMYNSIFKDNENHISVHNTYMENSSMINNKYMGGVMYNINMVNSEIRDSHFAGMDEPNVHHIDMVDSKIINLQLYSIEYKNVIMRNSIQSNIMITNLGEKGYYKNNTLINSKENGVHIAGTTIENLVYNNSNIEYRGIGLTNGDRIINITYNNCKNFSNEEEFCEIQSDSMNIKNQLITKDVFTNRNGELVIKYIDENDELKIEKL